jgi:hypothetical protein
MMIGRSDERVNPGRATAIVGRSIVVVSFAEPIWASGHRAASTGRTHDRRRTARQILQKASCASGAVHTCASGGSSLCAATAKPAIRHDSGLHGISRKIWRTHEFTPCGRIYASLVGKCPPLIPASRPSHLRSPQQRGGAAARLRTGLPVRLRKLHVLQHGRPRHPGVERHGVDAARGSIMDLQQHGPTRGSIAR